MNFKAIFKLKLLIGFILLTGCIQSTEEKIEAQAIFIAQRLDSGAVNTFREWDFTNVGKVYIWTNSSSRYGCEYFKGDHKKLSIGRFKEFQKDFPCNFNIDTTFTDIEFVKINDTSICISAYDRLRTNHILSKTILLKELFKTKDPFKYFESLSDLKDSLGIAGVMYYPEFGNYIRFFLDSNYELIYFPDNSYLNPKSKEFGFKELIEGKFIKRNWYLRKVPLDPD